MTLPEPQSDDIAFRVCANLDPVALCMGQCFGLNWSMSLLNCSQQLSGRQSSECEAAGEHLPSVF